ncbi:MAG: glycerate kinase [Mucilaginibacter sp.]
MKARQKGIQVIGIAGRVPLEHDVELAEYFDALFSINNEPCDMMTALANTTNNLVRTAVSVGNVLAVNSVKV